MRKKRTKKQKLFAILKTLALSGSVTTLTRLAKLSGFRNAADRDFRECLEDLKKREIIEVRQSGFIADSMHHPKIVILKADLILVYPSSEEEIEEFSEEEIKFSKQEPSELDERWDLVKIRLPGGGISYMMRKDWVKEYGVEKTTD